MPDPQAHSLVTQQPLGGKAQFGGQRFGDGSLGSSGLRSDKCPPGSVDC